MRSALKFQTGGFLHNFISHRLVHFVPGDGGDYRRFIIALSVSSCSAATIRTRTTSPSVSAELVQVAASRKCAGLSAMRGRMVLTDCPACKAITDVPTRGRPHELICSGRALASISILRSLHDQPLGACPATALKVELNPLERPSKGCRTFCATLRPVERQGCQRLPSVSCAVPPATTPQERSLQRRASCHHQLWLDTSLPNIPKRCPTHRQVPGRGCGRGHRYFISPPESFEPSKRRTIDFVPLAHLQKVAMGHLGHCQVMGLVYCLRQPRTRGLEGAFAEKPPVPIERR
jgi:hypothetical protein